MAYSAVEKSNASILPRFEKTDEANGGARTGSSLCSSKNSLKENPA